MAGNHNNFRSNQFASYIIPLVDHFSTPGASFNPFEAWAAANVLTAFTQRWQGPSNNLNGTYAERTGNGNSKLVDTFASKIEYAANRERIVAFTNFVKQLEIKLKSAFVGGSNAWVDWLYAVDYFFKNVPFVDYIINNRFKGEYTDLLYDSLAMTKHPNLTVNGYDFIITNPVQGQFIIDFRNVIASDLNSKFSVIVNPDTLENNVIWWNVDGTGVQPVVSVTDPIYIELNILSTDDPTQISKILEVEIASGALGFLNTIESGELLILEFVAVVALTGEELKPGSAASGVDFEFFDKLYASDNTELASGIETMEEYAAAFNDLRVPYEFTTFDIRYPYIVGNTAGGSVLRASGGDCGDCKGMSGYVDYLVIVGDEILEEGCRRCFKYGNAATSSLRTAPYAGRLYGTPVNYNTPGTIFNVVEGGKDVLSVKDID
jgi:hypothetical protein